MSVTEPPDYFMHLRHLFEVPPPVGSIGKPLLTKESAKTGPMTRARERAFLDHVKALLAGIELGRVAPGYATPAIRLDYVRYINGLDGASWVKPAGLDKTSAGKWRTSETLLQAATVNGAEGWEIRRRILDMLRASGLKERASLPWILWGPQVHPMLRTMENRIEWAVAMVWGNRRTKGQDPVAILTQREFPAVRQLTNGAEAQTKKFLDEIERDSGMMVPSGWITGGDQSPPASIAAEMEPLRSSMSAADLSMDEHVELRVSRTDLLRLWTLFLHAIREHPEEKYNTMFLPFWSAMNRGKIPRLLRSPGVLTPDELVEMLKPQIPRRFVDPLVRGTRKDSSASQLEAEMRKDGLLPDAAMSKKVNKKKRTKTR